MGKVLQLVKKKEEDYGFLKVEGPPGGPYFWSSSNVNNDLLMTVRHYIQELENELFNIMQGAGDEDEAG